MSSRITTCHRHRSTRPSDSPSVADCRAVVRELVESLAREMHLPRGVPSAPGQPGYVSWRAARENLLPHQLDMLAEERRRREVSSSRA
jgi:hypothetical protein